MITVIIMMMDELYYRFLHHKRILHVVVCIDDKK